ncbi:MAG: nucleotidyltransferase domain-containing protein [Bacillota bacterium]
MVSDERSSDLQMTAQILREYLRNRTDVLAAYLFGSLVTGKARSRSDADLALLFCSGLDKFARFDRQMEVALDLERLLSRKVDVLDMQSAPPILQHQILRSSELLLDRMPGRRKEFEVNSRRVFLELQPHYARRTEALLKKFRGGDRDG